MHPASNRSSDSIEATAAEWMARRDRGLNAAEQDSYLEWLQENPRHAAAIARMENAWGMLDRLSEWRPVHSPQPNPDLLAPPRRHVLQWSGLLAAAAMLVFAAILWWPQAEPQQQQRHAILHPGPERLALDDGSIVELNAGAKVEVNFTAQERRVQLVRGEALFTVAKNPARPFIVSADKFAVRAVGTAFTVSLEKEAVSVLVTEGKVRLDDVSGKTAAETDSPRELSHLVAGQQAVLSTAFAAADSATTASPALQVREVTPAEIERALSWQGLRLEFVDMPLGDVVAEFNRYNVRKLVVGDPDTAAIVVGGSFRANNVDAFVRLLDSGFGVAAFPRGNEIVLRRLH